MGGLMEWEDYKETNDSEAQDETPEGTLDGMMMGNTQGQMLSDASLQVSSSLGISMAESTNDYDFDQVLGCLENYAQKHGDEACKRLMWIQYCTVGRRSLQNEGYPTKIPEM